MNNWSGSAGQVGVGVVGGRLAEVGGLAHLLHLVGVAALLLQVGIVP